MPTADIRRLKQGAGTPPPVRGPAVMGTARVRQIRRILRERPARSMLEITPCCQGQGASLRLLIPGTGPVTDRLRVPEIGDHEGRRQVRIIRRDSLG